jgi:oligopeptide transport system permease protein
MPEETIARRRPVFTAANVGAAVLILMCLLCVGSLPVTLQFYDSQFLGLGNRPPSFSAVEMPGAETKSASDQQPGRWHQLLGTDKLGRSMLIRCLLGGAISLGIGLAAAAITMVIGTAWGMVAGYAGGRIDSAMMRIVDVLYGLPYILLVVLTKVAMEPAMVHGIAAIGGAVGVTWLIANAMTVANGVTLLLAIGAVSWLTLARVVRGQVLSIRGQPFIEAARATGCGPSRILLRHVLPNLLGPIIVYTTLTVPQAILQESFLSFLGIGVQPPLPSWGSLASDGLTELNPIKMRLWLLAWPCGLLAATLLALNFVGDGLRDRYDPRTARRRAAKNIAKPVPA